MDTHHKDGTGHGDALSVFNDFMNFRFLGNWDIRACCNDVGVSLDRLNAHFELLRIGVVCNGKYDRDILLDKDNHDRVGQYIKHKSLEFLRSFLRTGSRCKSGRPPNV